MENLPKLTEEQVEAILKYVSSKLDYEHINEDNICCGSDGVDSGVIWFKNTFREAFGIKVEWSYPYSDEEEDEEE